MNPAASTLISLSCRTRLVAELERVEGRSFSRDHGSGTKAAAVRAASSRTGRVRARRRNFLPGTGGAAAFRERRAARARRPAFEAHGRIAGIDPRNPFGPTVHMNIRFLLAISRKASRVVVRRWNGHDSLLRVRRDARHFHPVCRQALDAFGVDLYPRSKRVREYFYIKARGRTTRHRRDFLRDLNDAASTGASARAPASATIFLPAYVPVLERRRSLPTASASVTSRPIAAAAMWSSISSMIAARCSACSRRPRRIDIDVAASAREMAL